MRSFAAALASENASEGIEKSMYRNCLKRVLDFLLSLLALLAFSPLMLALTILGAIKMKGNPFFTQLRPGKQEKLFRLIKFRTMTCEVDEKGEPLPDEQRLTKYGKFLRATSLDELPELLNILKGDMSIVGPRPLLPKYLPLYNEEQHKRHLVRPGLTGYAQANGRNGVPWPERFKMDVEYVSNITFLGDCKIILKTVQSVLRHDGISSATDATMDEFFGNEPETASGALKEEK